MPGPGPGISHQARAPGLVGKASSPGLVAANSKTPVKPVSAVSPKSPDAVVEDVVEQTNGDVEMKPEEPKKPDEIVIEETEVDDASDLRKKNAGEILLSQQETTLNVITDGSFAQCHRTEPLCQFIACARATHGVRAGRTYYEVKFVDATQGPFARIGFTASAPAQNPTIYIGDKGTCGFEMAGKVLSDEETTISKTTRFSVNDVVGVMVNLVKGSPNEGTFSLFKNGKRASEPIPFPESFKGKAVFPLINFAGTAVITNFGQYGSWTEMPFKCHMMKNSAMADLQMSIQPTATSECAIIVGLPDEGYTDLDARKNHMEISARAAKKWASKSRIHLQGGDDSVDNMNAKLVMSNSMGMRSQLPMSSFLAMLRTMAAHTKRNVAIYSMDNLIKERREAICKTFSAPWWKKVAVIAVGTPPPQFLLKQKDLQLSKMQEQQEKELNEARRKVEMAKLAREKKREQKIKTRLTQLKKDTGNDDLTEVDVILSDDEEQVEEVEIKAPHPAELDPNFKFFNLKPADISPVDLARKYASYSLPTQMGIEKEPFTTFEWMWDKQPNAEKRLTAFKKEHKTKTIPTGIEFSEGILSKLRDWKTTRSGWMSTQQHAKRLNPKDDVSTVDVMKCDDINNALNGAPLYKEFAAEDWSMAESRFKFHLLVNAIQQDVTAKDPDHVLKKEFIQSYWRALFKENCNWGMFGAPTVEGVMEHMNDTVFLAADGSLATIHGETVPFDMFVKFTEEARRERLRRIESGDESAKLVLEKASVVTTSAVKGKGKSDGKGKGGDPWGGKGFPWGGKGWGKNKRQRFW